MAVFVWKVRLGIEPGRAQSGKKLRWSFFAFAVQICYRAASGSACGEGYKSNLRRYLLQLH